MRTKLTDARRKLRRARALRKAGDKAKTPDARDMVRKRARGGNPIWFPWARR